jgi:hypothetical protein
MRSAEESAGQLERVESDNMDNLVAEPSEAEYAEAEEQATPVLCERATPEEAEGAEELRPHSETANLADANQAFDGAGESPEPRAASAASAPPDVALEDADAGPTTAEASLGQADDVQAETKVEGDNAAEEGAANTEDADVGEEVPTAGGQPEQQEAEAALEAERGKTPEQRAETPLPPIEFEVSIYEPEEQELQEAREEATSLASRLASDDSRQGGQIEPEILGHRAVPPFENDPMFAADPIWAADEEVRQRTSAPAPEATAAGAGASWMSAEGNTASYSDFLPEEQAGASTLEGGEPEYDDYDDEPAGYTAAYDSYEEEEDRSAMPPETAGDARYEEEDAYGQGSGDFDEESHAGEPSPKVEADSGNEYDDEKYEEDEYEGSDFEDDDAYSDLEEDVAQSPPSSSRATTAPKAQAVSNSRPAKGDD